jgi:hypothetical protein
MWANLQTPNADFDLGAKSLLMRELKRGVAAAELDPYCS